VFVVASQASGSGEPQSGPHALAPFGGNQSRRHVHVGQKLLGAAELLFGSEGLPLRQLACLLFGIGSSIGIPAGLVGAVALAA
jgi:hypothetical protein